MITPLFTVSQNEEFVLLDLQVKYIRSADAEFLIAEKDVKFYCKPYLLKLSLPHPVVEDGREKATYDIDKGLMKVFLPKKEKGLFFPHLDMLTKLIAKKPVAPEVVTPLIEVIEEPGSKKEEPTEVEFDWTITPSLPEPEQEGPFEGSICYGFNNQYHDFFRNVASQAYDITDNPNPENLTLEERKELRAQTEARNFGLDHYMMDFIECEAIEEAVRWIPSWDAEYLKKQELFLEHKAASKDTIATKEEKAQRALLAQQKIDEAAVPFDKEQLETLLKLPNKEYIVSNPRILLYGVVDILFAYAYDYRTTKGEHTVESAWTIRKLSATLSWQEQFVSAKDALSASVRRSLVYPLYRHWKLSTKVIHDVKKILMLGKRAVLRCFLDIHRLFNTSDNKHYLNHLYIRDYCIWLQTVGRSDFKQLRNEVKPLVLAKTDSGLPLAELEKLAIEMKNEKPKDNEQPKEL
mmetsp:Transcript_24493/g.27238  ORF Transcript_24493/g.27238 Transcript_24493/m.27238 type:complete len:464 (-) Transcript_24493:28-1419(-)